MPPESTGRQPQKHILLTRTFQRNLKRLRRHFSEQDVVEDVRRFVRGGLRPGETELKAQTFGDVKITVVKLRLGSRDRSADISSVLSESESTCHCSST